MAGELLRIKMLKVPFNYEPRRNAVAVIRELGAYPVGHGPGKVTPDMAQAAIDAGYAQRFNPRGKAAETLRQEQASEEADAAADEGSANRVDHEDLADDDRPDDRPPVDDAG